MSPGQRCRLVNGAPPSLSSLRHFLDLQSKPDSIFSAVAVQKPAASFQHLLPHKLEFALLQVEVEVILAAHRLYAETGCLDGIDSLVDLTTLSVLRWASQHEVKALASLAAG